MKTRGLSAKTRNLEEIKKLCYEHNINTSGDYRKKYKDIPGLVAHPDRVFKSEWNGWPALFDKEGFYTYEEMVSINKKNKLKTQSDYRAFVEELNDERMPLDPQKVYNDKWENWFKYLSKPEPYQTKFIQKEYGKWADSINEFILQAHAGNSKVSHLCRFVREYIEAFDFSHTPEKFLTQETKNIRPFRNYLETLKTDNHRRNVVLAVNEFFDYVIKTKLTNEDFKTGQIVRVENAHNPFRNLEYSYVANVVRRGETSKACLQYYFVKKLQNWIAPEGIGSFRALKNIQAFDADWIKVEEDILDKSDLDCVYKKIGSSYYLWNPINWIHLLALVSVPLRGKQIAYNDSGEADVYIADLDEINNIIWKKNDSPMSGMTNNQSFIKKMDDGELGMYVTTNKSSVSLSGYSIPWIPEKLAFWLVKLRKWQQKYNPIDQPTSWTICARTNFNQTQLEARGVNCFLFRDFEDVEPKSVSAALTPRLAAALFHIQPDGLILSNLNGSNTNISNYKSKYTPHSMRVSLITAYVVEQGIKPEIIMKIVGHSSIVMTIYYCKVSTGEIRRRLNEADKAELKNEAVAIQKIIEQNEIESIKDSMVGNNDEVLASISNHTPTGNFVFRDYGFCPYAASRCSDGGELIGKTRIHQPVVSGYLGVQNCVRCRHFVTGPAFLGGLLSLTNEILLECNAQSEQCIDLQNQINGLEKKLVRFERVKYLSEYEQKPFDNTDILQAELCLRKLESENEGAAKKMDMLLCDLQASYKLISSIQSIMNKELSNKGECLSLMTLEDSEVQIELSEATYFEQLQEVCENATIYQCASAKNAITPRSQILDKMAAYNGLKPSLFTLNKRQQLYVGNQMVKFLQDRLKSFDKFVKLINCDIKMCDLVGEERINPSEIEVIANSQYKQLERD